MTFHNIWECHHPNWRTHIFQRGWNHQSKTCLEISVVQGSEIFQPMIVGQSWELVQLMVVFDASHCQHVETGQRISCSLKLLKKKEPWLTKIGICTLIRDWPRICHYKPPAHWLGGPQNRHNPKFKWYTRRTNQKKQGVTVCILAWHFGWWLGMNEAELGTRFWISMDNDGQPTKPYNTIQYMDQ